MKNLIISAITITLMLQLSSGGLFAQTDNNLKVIGYISIDGTKQGKLKSDDGSPQSKIKIYGFGYQANLPGTLLPTGVTGKRQHSPVSVIKPLSYCTPQLFQAFYTNEVLKSVVIELVKKQSDGSEVIYYTVRLTNATISKIGEKADPAGANVTNNIPLEEVLFNFQRIEMEHKEAKTMVMDDNIN